MLPPYLDEPRNLWSPAIAIGVSTVSAALYGVKDQTKDASILVAIFFMMGGGFSIATFLSDQIHERVRFLVTSSLVFVVVLDSWFIAGAVHKSAMWLTPFQSNVVLWFYCASGFWALASKQSRRAFENGDPRAVAFGAFVVIVFVFPFTNASAYSNDLGIMFWHYALFTLLYFMRVAYVLNFEKQHPPWLLVQTVFGTIWLLDVPFYPSIPIYTFLFVWTAYKFRQSVAHVDSMDDSQMKQASSKPVAPTKLPPAAQAYLQAASKPPVKIFKTNPTVGWGIGKTEPASVPVVTTDSPAAPDFV